jgi:hypothetical protein
MDLYLAQRFNAYLHRRKQFLSLPPPALDHEELCGIYPVKIRPLYIDELEMVTSGCPEKKI